MMSDRQYVVGPVGSRREARLRLALPNKGRLADPELACQRLKVTALLGDGGIAIDVIDQGPGFVPGTRKSSVASGRGISLIETLVSGWELLDDGRRIRLRFDR